MKPPGDDQNTGPTQDSTSRVPSLSDNTIVSHAHLLAQWQHTSSLGCLVNGWDASLFVCLVARQQDVLSFACQGTQWRDNTSCMYLIAKQLVFYVACIVVVGWQDSLPAHITSLLPNFDHSSWPKTRNELPSTTVLTWWWLHRDTHTSLVLAYFSPIYSPLLHY